MPDPEGEGKTNGPAKLIAFSAILFLVGVGLCGIGSSEEMRGAGALVVLVAGIGFMVGIVWRILQ